MRESSSRHALRSCDRMRRRRRRRVAAILAPGAAARPAQPAAPAAGAHPCLVMTGSGDAAFTRSFNPYTGSVLNGGFMKGAIYEPLVVATVAGGGHIYPWLATELEVEQRQQDADAADRSRTSSGRMASR